MSVALDFSRKDQRGFNNNCLRLQISLLYCQKAAEICSQSVMSPLRKGGDKGGKVKIMFLKFSAFSKFCSI